MTRLKLGKCAAAAALTPPARRVHLEVLKAAATTGRAPVRTELERIARDQGSEPDAVLAELGDRDVIAFDACGEIRAAYPFSPSPTSIQVTWSDGPSAYAMCAIDALGMSAMLGHPVKITAAEPGTTAVIIVEADGVHARWNPDTAVVFAGSKGDRCGPAADQSCGYISFFTSAEAACAWAARHPDINGTLLHQAEALEDGVAEFGTLMHHPIGRWRRGRCSQTDI
ncbi:MAG TPA: organomercurial lyase [Streptosporangiaceae bacterium]|nr:organomercurial lyase [Streptosporangiaceae bacterium]